MNGSEFEAVQNRFPDHIWLDDEVRLSADDFAKQKEKHLKAGSVGGAIGVVRNESGRVILTRRSAMHAGWALPGGTIERGEDPQAAFEREIAEEVGIQVTDVTLVMVESKAFVSPAGEVLPFRLAVFTAKTDIEELPWPTPAAMQEGLTIGLFAPADLPERMVLKDREKLDLCLSGMNFRRDLR